MNVSHRALFARLARREERQHAHAHARGNRRRAPTNAFRSPERRKHLVRRFSRRRRRRHLFVGVPVVGSVNSVDARPARDRSCASPKNAPTIDVVAVPEPLASRARSFCPRESSRTSRRAAPASNTSDSVSSNSLSNASSIPASTSPSSPMRARRTRLATRSADAPTFRASTSTARRRPSRVPPRARPSPRRSRAQHHLSAVPNLPQSAPTPTRARSFARAHRSIVHRASQRRANRPPRAATTCADDASTVDSSARRSACVSYTHLHRGFRSPLCNSRVQRDTPSNSGGIVDRDFHFDD